MAKLDQAIIWKEATDGNLGHNAIYQTRYQLQSEKEKLLWTVVAFGECGQGKSTALSKISLLYNRMYSRKKYTANFYHKKALRSVTSVVDPKTTGSMTLIDTPGFNDGNLLRTDKNILNELTKSIRPRLYDKT